MHQHKQAPIAIGRLQRYAMDAFDASGGKLVLKTTQQRHEKVACLGAGPASLAAAAELRQQGFAVTVFDKKTLPGGLNTYGVAEYKLPTSDSLREIERIAEIGVEFRFGVDLNDEALLDQLEKSYDAIFVGVGLGSMHRLAIPGGDHPSVIDALKFIEDYKLGIRTSMSGSVVVIGAGNTAIDAANAAKRLGAEQVRILYRRTREHISAFNFEYEHARQEGVTFEWLVQPAAVHAAGAEIESVECMRMEIDVAGAISPIPGSNFNIPCDLVIPAIGQSPLLELLSKCRGLIMERGRVVIDRATGQTANPKYFAGGDCVNGGREVVDAVADGKRAGIGIAKFVGSVHVA
jgi:glutamate synthase (NADPH/NADH) small chain